LAIAGFNNSIGFVPGVKKIEKLDPDKVCNNIMESGGSSVALGLLDDTVKLAR
jgi:hypothetical protein